MMQNRLPSNSVTPNKAEALHFLTKKKGAEDEKEGGDTSTL